MTVSQTFRVEGMTCDHCVAAVREEVSRVGGVAEVDVDLATGRMTIFADDAIDADEVRAAVRSAGYEIAA
ncbi:heavy-metal-associated domain-containing protein [Rhabdothermincola sediminis]|uniref:heavy-metal-associated domain-containing protein n=1 Tax=Rhabdothermincola sediminis TaxID=2751370 RepID=UPI001AA0A978|nr:heavy metal-associated domain-containing protein [Rhabdothermincola sediminis]